MSKKAKPAAGKAAAIPNGAYAGRHSGGDRDAYRLAQHTFESSSIPLLDKLESFPRFATKRSLAHFMAKQRLFEKVLDINGIIVECGVFSSIEMRSLWNQYPLRYWLRYWLRLLPVSAGLKHGLVGFLERLGLGGMAVSANVGNMISIGCRVP